jgi:hypothetical protein
LGKNFIEKRKSDAAVVFYSITDFLRVFSISLSYGLKFSQDCILKPRFLRLPIFSPYFHFLRALSRGISELSSMAQYLGYLCRYTLSLIPNSDTGRNSIATLAECIAVLNDFAGKKERVESEWIGTL